MTKSDVDRARQADLTKANLTEADLTWAYRPENGIPGWQADEDGRLTSAKGGEMEAR